jgi:general secretion pathway protein G
MRPHRRRQLDHGGFTLVELVIIIVILGILAAVAIPQFTDLTDSSKINATRQELHTLQRAIVGEPNVVSGGRHADRGFEGDVGFAPSRLEDLTTRPDSVPAYNPLSRLGWNGPYIDSSGGDYLTDAWGAAYVYQPSTRRILSVGGSDTIATSF